MKIAIFHELPKGGARRAINAYARELKKRHSVDLFLVNEEINTLERNNFHNIFFYRFIPRKWKGNDWKTRLYKDTVELFLIYKLNQKIAKDIDEKNYDIVIVSASQYIETPFILRFLKTSSVFYSMDPYYRIIYDPIFAISKDLDTVDYFYEKTNRFIRRILDRQNVHASKITISPSRFIASLFSKTYHRKSIVSYLGVDATFFKPSHRKKDIDIFYIGSYDPVDGYSLLTDSLTYMKKKPIIRSVLKEKEWISDDKILRDLYRRAKIVFCPAHKEGLGLVLLEALACGTLVVAVDEAGHKEIIKSKDYGYLVSRNPKKIAQLLDLILSNNVKLRKLGYNGRKYIENYWTWDKRTRELEKNLEKNCL